MKVLFKNIPADALFIEAKLLPNYYVFQKTSPATAKIYGREEAEPLTFDKTQEMVIVKEMSFSELPAVPFALARSAKAACGIIVPLEVLIKRFPDDPLEPYGEYVDVNQTRQPLPIDGGERVINLGDIFNFHEITVACLNV